jgi:hypothetical protein
MNALSRSKKLIAGGVLVLAGFGAGVAIAVTGSASAQTDGVTTQAGQAGDDHDPSKSVRPDEHLLSGTTAQKVRAAALAKYPKATLQRVETDSDGVYEAHVVTAGGQELIVQVGKDFAVTGTVTGHGPGGDHHGDHDGPPAQGGSGA